MAIEKYLTQQEFIIKILPAVLANQAKTGMRASVTLAQAILESGWGKCSIGNNIFGIKASKKWTGKTQLVETTEFIKGIKQHMKLAFRDYDSIQDSINDHSKLMLLPRYKPVIEAKDYIIACDELQKCGYSTSPIYSLSLKNIIRKYELFKHDKK